MAAVRPWRTALPYRIDHLAPILHVSAQVMLIDHQTFERPLSLRHHDHLRDLGEGRVVSVAFHYHRFLCGGDFFKKKNQTNILCQAHGGDGRLLTIGREGAEREETMLRVEGEELEVELAGAGETLASRPQHQTVVADGEQRGEDNTAAVRGAGGEKHTTIGG